MTVLNVRHTAKAAKFYETLGFHCHGIWDSDQKGFAIVQRGDVTLALDGSTGLRVPKNSWWSVYIYVDDARTFRSDLISRGVSVDELRENNAYGCIDFDVTDLDGHKICFGQDLNPENGPGLGANRGAG